MRKILKYILLIAIGWLLLNTPYILFGVGLEAWNGTQLLDALKEGLIFCLCSDWWLDLARETKWHIAMYSVALVALFRWIKKPNFIIASVVCVTGYWFGPGIYWNPYLAFLMAPFSCVTFCLSLGVQYLWDNEVRPWLVKRKHS